MSTTKTKTKKPAYQLITSTAELRSSLLTCQEENPDEPSDFFILLANNLRSSKSIQLLLNNRLAIFNETDETRQTLTFEQLYDTSKSNIGAAIDAGNFYAC